MISPKKLIKLAKKWQRIAAPKRKRISLPIITSNTSSSVADKGHFVIYTNDQNRFVIPILYLNNPIFQELLRMSEEEFNLPISGRITLPFDAIFMEYAVSLIKGCVDKTVEEDLLMYVARSRCTLSHNSLHYDHTNTQQSIICSC